MPAAPYIVEVQNPEATNPHWYEINSYIKRDDAFDFAEANQVKHPDYVHRVIEVHAISTRNPTSYGFKR